MATLQNLCVLVTRPKPQGEELCEKIRAKQGKPIYLPTINIVPTTNTAELQQKINALDQCSHVIFVSPNAVEQSAAMIKQKWPVFPAQTKVIAVGASTAATLQRAKLPVELFPATDWSSEGVLELPELQNLTGKRVAIVCGEDGRETMTNGLRQRGATVDTVIAYRRELPNIANVSEYTELFQAQKIDIIVCTSGTGLTNLLKILGDTIKARVQQVTLLVVSERLVALAEELNFKHVFLAENASHDGILGALETIQNMLGKIYGGQEHRNGQHNSAN